ncbi:TM0106 family RecB-like putative nuclease [Cellulosimicrobium cellulans]|uniref:TM0106 family RecB-like putative nuclease n=1 Tax=Cellulosimicrobium cellulans TaxID=1710 RepID=UPI000848D920|nr:TM0106 family RecB-like putative nuclease [Cellulosimicrobium cellulans]
MFLVDEPVGKGAATAPVTTPLLVHAPRDLVVAAACEYQLLCRLDEQLGRAPRREDAADAMLDRVAALGARHEQAVLAQYESRHGAYSPTTGRGVLRLDAPRHPGWDDLVAAHARTLAALEAGVDVVHGAVLFDGAVQGRADLLVRTSADDARYAVLGMRLARRAKVPALIQLAAHADQLLAAGVPVDPEVSLVLGTRARTTHRLADLLPVYRDRRARLLRLTGEHLARDGRAPWDDPAVRACGRCADCRAQVEVRRDVLLVGGVYETQRARLHAAGIRTIDELAAATTAPEGMSTSAFERVRDQAALQLGTGRADGTVVWADAAGPHELSWRIDDPAPVHALPAPSPGDLFFDFEGDPLWADADGRSRGIDYLFGWVGRPAQPGEEPPFHALWAHDLAAERDALVAFVDHVNARRREHPDLHVYHYAAYEKTHLLSIAARHGVYEEEVDDLLRDGVLVDLYAVVRQALRVSDRSRSIKKLEPLYMGDDLRTGDVKDAAASVVAYAEYTALRDAGKDAEAAELLRGIEDYNRYDCVSTLRLLEWLRGAVGSGSGTGVVVGSGAGSEGARAVHHPRPRASDAPARPATTARTPSDPAVDVTSGGGTETTTAGPGGSGGVTSVGADRAAAAGTGGSEGVASGPREVALALEAEIRGVVGEERAGRDAAAQALAMYGAAVGYHRREAKPFWHEHYLRLTLPVDEWLGRRNAFVVEAAEVVGDWEVEPGRQTWSRRLELVGRLPEGTDLRAGVAPYVLYDPPLPPCARTSADGVRGWLTGGAILDAGRRAGPGGERDVLRVREQLPRGAEPFEALPIALTPAPGPGTAPLEAAIATAARRALESWRDTGDLPRDAVTDVLLRRPPRLHPPTAEGRYASASPRGVEHGPASLPAVVDGDLVEAITAAVERLEDSYVAVQGPPGTGKTHVGAHVVARLVRQGWRVGVVAQSHATVENMLRAVVEKAGVPAGIVAKKRAGDGPSPSAVCAELDGAALAAFATEPGPRVVGGTAWDFAADRLPERTLDLLVVDEAGQLSLASTVAVGRAARRLLLLGDPQQLPQVSQGTHPEPVDRSALGWLADGHGVLPDERGYFLPVSWRMHPRLAAAVSRLSYEGRLGAHPVAAARHLDGVPPGVEEVLVEHTGNAVRSTQEAAEVVRQVERFLGRAWTEERAGAPRPLEQRDVLVVAAYNAQVWAVRSALAAAGLTEVEVGTVDRFQGKEAPVVVLTLAASSGHDVARGLGFLLSRNRVTVAVSRAQWTAVVVRSPALTDHLPGTPRGVEELGAFLGLAAPAPDDDAGPRGA